VGRLLNGAPVSPPPLADSSQTPPQRKKNKRTLTLQTQTRRSHRRGDQSTKARDRLQAAPGSQHWNKQSDKNPTKPANEDAAKASRATRDRTNKSPQTKQHTLPATTRGPGITAGEQPSSADNHNTDRAMRTATRNRGRRQTKQSKTEEQPG
jgi:hypothetical protein